VIDIDLKPRCCQPDDVIIVVIQSSVV